MCKFHANQFTVTRQLQWPSGHQVVEINQGGFDYANPDMMGVRFRKLGEGETFNCMTDAIKAGIAVLKAWIESCPNEEIGIAVGNTGGATCPFDGKLFDDDTEAELLAKAEEFDANLDRCERCAEVMTSERYGIDGEYNFCSEYCAEESAREWAEEIEAEDAELMFA